MRPITAEETECDSFEVLVSKPKYHIFAQRDNGPNSAFNPFYVSIVAVSYRKLNEGGITSTDMGFAFALFWIRETWCMVS